MRKLFGQIFDRRGASLPAAPRLDRREGAEMSEPEPDWPTVVELQRTELDRLLRENARLRENVDRLMQLQEREQVLRQQLQGQLERLTERMALPAPDGGAKRQETRQLEARLLASEQKFASLRQAVGLLVDHLETSRRQSRREAEARGLMSGRGGRGLR